jgi:hypothetical protein
LYFELRCALDCFHVFRPDSVEVVELSRLIGVSASEVLKEIRWFNLPSIFSPQKEILIQFVREIGPKIDEIRSEVVALQSAVAQSSLEIHQLKESVQSLSADVRCMDAHLRSMRDAIHAIAQNGGTGQKPVPVLHFIVDQDAQKFWASYFPVSEEVSWAEFSKALTTELGDLSRNSLQNLKQELDIDGDDKVHAREFNIFTKKFGLTDTVKRFAASSDSEDPEGKTPLYRAARANDSAEVGVLLAGKADPNYRQKYKLTTPLHAAAYYGFVEVAEILLLAGARADVRNVYEKTALEEAEEGQHAQIATFIRNSTIRGRDRAARR